MAVWKATGKKPVQLVEQPPLPPALAYLWGWFTELQQGAAPLSYQEILAWSQLTGRQATGTEVQVLRQLDAIYWKPNPNVRHN